MKNKPTETKFKSSLGAARHLIGSTICLGALTLICSSAPAQNLFVSDYTSGNIYEFTASGVRSTFASGLSSGAVAFDEAGNLFVAGGNGAVYKITPAGSRTTFAFGLDGLKGLAFDSAGNLFVTTGDEDGDGFPIEGSGKIYKLTPNGVRTTFASGLDLPTALAFDSAGNLFVANVKDFNSEFIYKFTPAGGRTTFASGLTNPETVAFDNAGNLFVSASILFGNTGVIYEFTSDGVESTFVDGFSPFAPLAFDSAGDLFVSDQGGNIYKFTPSGVQSTFASGLSGFLAFQPIQTSGAGRLQNISTRLRVQTGDNVLIGGFVITGTQPKQLLIRAIGPSLTSFGISDVLADPVLELHDGAGTLITSNDNWMDAPNRQEIIDSGIPPTNDLESAILMTLDPGPYTAIVRGVNDTTGIALVEAYDLDLAADSVLANISTRGLVQAGDDVMIGGIIIFGPAPQAVLLCAMGPSLPVAGALADPTLELYDKDGVTIATNDDWRSDQEADIIATTIAPTEDAESAILMTLTPGAYTAIVRGNNDTTGVALVEAYQLDN
jgi:sugar lactone lactonase YvrE